MMNACVIDIDTEINEIVAHLQPLEGYLDCEKAVIQNIKKHLDKGYDDEIIAACLEKISFALREKMESGKDSANSINCRYAAGFIDTLLRMPYWRTWMHTINKESPA